MNRLSAIVIPALCANIAIAVPVRFAADVTQAQTHQATAYRGETLEIEATLTDRGHAITNDAPATLYWQTNGMSSAWWTAPASMSGGVIRATWSPTNDVGASSYRVFLGVTDGGRNYRANMTLRMTGSPGDAPNALPLPAKTIDFAEVSVTNAPWALPYAAGDNVVITNGVISSTATGDAVDEDAVAALVENALAPLAEDVANAQADIEILAGGDAVLGGQILDLAATKASKTWVVSVIGGTNTWLAIDGDILAVCTSTNAVTTNVLWSSSAGAAAAVSNLQAAVSGHASRLAALEARPDLTSWGFYAPDGSPNPDSANTLMLNKPTTVMASGFSWATSGAFACLCQSGAVAFLTETNGEIRIGTDVTTNYFGLVQGGAVTVGCRTGGIRVADGVVELDYAYAGGAYPAIWYTAGLAPVAWTECTAPVWVDHGDGTATASLPATVQRGFFMATSTRDISARFRSNVPAELAGGVYGSIAQDPVRYDSTITVTSGGRTYRIPAQLVQ